MSEKLASCPLLWIAQGGKIVDGKYVFDKKNRASGVCDAPWDCYRCPLMQQEIAQHPPGQANWVCPSCLRDVTAKAKATQIKVTLTGHYSEGQCQYIHCTRPPRQELGDDGTVVELPRGHSRLLQLVIGDINH